MLHVVKVAGTRDDPIENISVAGLTIDASYWVPTVVSLASDLGAGNLSARAPQLWM